MSLSIEPELEVLLKELALANCCRADIVKMIEWKSESHFGNRNDLGTLTWALALAYMLRNETLGK